MAESSVGDMDRKNLSDAESDDRDSIPSSHHMSNSKYNELDCENDAGWHGNEVDRNTQEGIEPPRKRPRRGLNKEVNGDIEFEIIDEVDNDDEEHGNEDVSDDDDLSDEEIYAWLEEGVDRNALAEKDDGVPIEREKVVLKEKGHDPFDILPEGWVVVTHNSGMPVYLHKETRVCTLARPYFLGPGSVRKHDIPLSAIPCLQYKRELDKEDPLAETEKACKATENDELEGNKKVSEPGNTLPCSQPISEPIRGDGRAGTMETNTSGQETSSALAFGHIRNITKSQNSCEQEDNGDQPEVMETDSSALVTSAKEKSQLTMGVDGKSQLVTSSSDSRSQGLFNAEDLETNGAEGNLCSTVEESKHISENGDAEKSDRNVAAATVCSAKENGIGENSSACLSRETTQGDARLEVHPVKVESAEERRKQASLDPSAVRDYCSKLFEFKTITVRKYKTWRDRRRHMTQMKKQSRPELPPNTKLITCSLNVQTKPGDFKSAKRKEFLLNPSGKSYVCILHEYVQHTMRVQPRYIFKEMESALTPYSATVVISDVEYGVGFASSKKAAKLEAAKATLNILIPEMNKVTEDQKGEGEDLSFFDEIKIEDPRIYELGNKAGQPSPYQILCECLRRNYGLGETHCEMEMKQLKHQKSEFTMTVGKHTATVIAKNKRDGKQRAAQAILQKLHAHVTSWGSLLRLYGKCSEKYFAEKKDDMNINELQAQVKANRPNNAILDKLKEEMTRLHTQRGAIKSKGKLRLETTELPAKVPSLDL